MIIVLNFGSQFAHLIARRVRELGSYAEILPFNIPAEKIKEMGAKGIVLSGGPSSVYDESALFCDKKIFDLKIPILGICYGHQLIAKMLGGKVEKGKTREYGKEILKIKGGNGKGGKGTRTEDGKKGKKGTHANGGGKLFEGIDKKQVVWFSHGDTVSELPKGFRTTASTGGCRSASFENEKEKIYGVQFHPEVAHTENGTKILGNFIYKICKAEKNWTIKDVAKRLTEEIRKQVGKDAVIIGVSGGVDSMVAATLLHKTVGKKLYCIFIDTGMMRKNEPETVSNCFRSMGFENFEMIDASSEFLGALKGITDPEEKRKRIGHTFIRVFEEKAKELEKKNKIKFLAQGTIYPDRIESAQPSKNAAKIKSHHNVTLPEKMNFQIIEPIKELYKDEVRELGKELCISKELLWRHPFPGPGLAIRILGEVTDERLRILRDADDIFISELKREKQYDKIWQAFAALLPVKSVGVMGDQRTYEYVISLRAVTSKDGMTADWAKIPYDVLERISGKIINNVRGVNRILYDVSQKPPATIEYE